MSDQYRGRRDFSDIDNLDRATQSFLKEQHRALSGAKAIRAPRNRTEAQFNAMKYAKIGAIVAVLVLIVGVGIFAGIKFGSRNAGLIKPEPDNPPAVEEVTESSGEATKQTENTAASEIGEITTEETQVTTTVTTAPQTVSKTEESSSVTPASSETTSGTTRSTSTVTTAGGGAGISSQHASTTSQAATTPAARTTTTTRASTTKATTVTTTKTTTRATTKTTAKTTTKTTTTTTKTTTKATTTTTKTTTTTTTTAARANIVIQSITVSDWDNYNSGYSQILTINVKNTGNAAQTEVKKLAIQCSGAGAVTHVAATSSNTSGGISYSGETIYVPYYGKLAAGAADTITVRIITNELVWSCSY